MSMPDVTARSLPVVCVSLGGTKLAVGALTPAASFLAAPEFHWREAPDFAATLADPTAERFCEAVARRILAFLTQRAYPLSAVGRIGLPFPGPRVGELWYSNNLIQAFQQGVALERELNQALVRLAGYSPPVRVLFDAQCDAGGELFHPAGRLAAPAARPTCATVLNLATGVAAGFIKDGSVLVSDEDFRQQVAREYDGGAGQLGRHLLFHPERQQWTYHFCAHGQTPAAANTAIRLTERISGPALAARLLLGLGRQGLLDAAAWTSAEVPFATLAEFYQAVAECQTDYDLMRAAQLMRRAQRPVSSALLRWANEVYRAQSPAPAALAIHSFAREIAAELAAALRAWLQARGWASFGARIILTGGVGINFLAAAESQPERSFCRAVARDLPNCRVERSQLADATERESYLFLHCA